jgi:hypothetical protein
MNDGRCDQSPIRQTGLVPRRLAGCQPRLINTRSLLDRRLLFLRKWSHSSGHFLRPVGPSSTSNRETRSSFACRKVCKVFCKDELQRSTNDGGHLPTAEGAQYVARSYRLPWFGRCRRLTRDFERTLASAEAWVLLASARLLARRRARTLKTQRQLSVRLSGAQTGAPLIWPISSQLCTRCPPAMFILTRPCDERLGSKMQLAEPFSKA